MLVRINEIDTTWHIDDVALVSSLPISGVVLPKVEMSSGLLKLIADLGPRLPIVALIETARGLRDAFEIAAIPGIERLAFGSIDFLR
ncbi:citrate lyase beta subunit [Bradyrhizobium sp. USDA 4504]